MGCLITEGPVLGPKQGGLSCSALPSTLLWGRSVLWYTVPREQMQRLCQDLLPSCPPSSGPAALGGADFHSVTWQQASLCWRNQGTPTGSCVELRYLVSLPPLGLLCFPTWAHPLCIVTSCPDPTCASKSWVDLVGQ